MSDRPKRPIPPTRGAEDTGTAPRSLGYFNRPGVPQQPPHSGAKVDRSPALRARSVYEGVPELSRSRSIDRPERVFQLDIEGLQTTFHL
jgi:hypothetical protein